MHVPPGDSPGVSRRSRHILPILLATCLWANIAAAAIPPGRELARKYCSSCHLFPEPELLTKTAWAHRIQPDMAVWLGIERPDYEGMTDGRLLQDAGLFPSSPLLSEEEWFAIWDYYRAAAPNRMPALPPRAPARTPLPQFRARKISPTDGAPMISLIRIDAAGRRLYVGDAFAGMLYTLDPAGMVLSRLRLGSGPVSLEPGQRSPLVTCVGRIFPSDAREGSVLRLPREEGQPARAVLEHLRRPVHAVATDLNGDGREDLVVCSFGNRLGSFSWFENKGEGRYDEQILLDRPGAVQAAVRDFNRDGRPDLLVLMAQAREAFHLFLNQGAGRFALATLLEQPPSWGYAGFELTDFNRDGHLDLLVANGDNGDFALPLKPYHGIRVYLNDGTNHFTEAFVYPMHGAYKALARDFDGDGDLDIAGIAYYPDFERSPLENFVYLENQGGLKFAPHTCAESAAGRWLVMDAGDLDGDGDDDLALGSFVRGPTTVPVPMATREHWRTDGAAVLLLENQRR